MTQETIATMLVSNDQLIETGKNIGKLYTDMGYPIDMAMTQLKSNKAQKIVVLYGVCQWLLEHKRSSGAGEKALDRQRKSNRDIIENFITSGEVGIY